MNDFKRELTVSDHIFLGNLLKDARDAYLALLPAAHPKSSKLSRAINRGLKTIEQLRYLLEDCVAELVPHPHDPRGLLTQVYYGEGRLVRSDDDGEPAGNDAFAGWALIIPDDE